MKRSNGLTLVELLMVIAIVGALAAVLVPNLLRARQVAMDRAALSYAQNVYKAAQAYLGENPLEHTIQAGSCVGGVDFGGYNVPAPTSFLRVTDCTYTANATRVVVTYEGGTTSVQVVGD